MTNMIEKVISNGKEHFNKLFDNNEVILLLYKYCNTGGLAHYPRDGSTSWNELIGKVNQYMSLEL